MSINAYETEEEAEINKEMAELIKSYNEIYTKLLKATKDLNKIRDKFPKKFLESEEYEDLVIMASQAKYKSIDYKRIGIAQFTAIDADIKYYTAQLQLNVADGYLSTKFEKVTDKLRDSYVRSNVNIHKLSKLKGKIESLKEQTSDMVRQFTNDEFNFKTFMDRVHKIKGII
jgi:polyribonucleotide nucleotidyltransferase